MKKEHKEQIDALKSITGEVALKQSEHTIVSGCWETIESVFNIVENVENAIAEAEENAKSETGGEVIDAEITDGDIPTVDENGVEEVETPEATDLSGNK